MIFLGGEFRIAGEEVRKGIERLVALFFVLEVGGGSENGGANSFGSFGHGMDAREGGVGELLALVVRTEIEGFEERLDAPVLGEREVAVLVHPKDEEVEEGGLLFGGKTFGVHGARVFAWRDAVNFGRCH